MSGWKLSFRYRKRPDIDIRVHSDIKIIYHISWDHTHASWFTVGSSDFDKHFENCYALCSFRLSKDIVDTCVHPWQWSDQLGVLRQPCTASVYKLLCNFQYTSAVVPLVVPPSIVVTPIRLYPLYCTLYPCTLTLTCRHLQALVAFSFAFISNIFASISWCTLYWLQLHKLFLLPISLRNLQTFCFILFVGSCPELPQHSILNTFVFLLVFSVLLPVFLAQFSTLGCHPTKAGH